MKIINKIKRNIRHIKMPKETKLHNDITDLCKKYKITVQMDRVYNDDWHLQFRKRCGYSQNEKYSFYGFEYAECFISNYDIKYRKNKNIISDLKGFLRMSFKTVYKKRSK